MTELKKWSGGQGNLSTEELTDLFGGSSKKTDEADEWAFAEEFGRTDDVVEAAEQHNRKPKGSKGSRRDGESREGGSAGGQNRGNRRPNNRKDSSRSGRGDRFENAYDEEEAPRRKNNNFRGKNGKGKPYYNRKNNPSSGKGGKSNKTESAE